MQISGSMRCWRNTSTDTWLTIISRSREGGASVEADVLEVHGLLVDPAGRRRDPVGEAARLGDPSHLRRDECTNHFPRQPVQMLVGAVAFAHNVPAGFVHGPLRR